MLEKPRVGEPCNACGLCCRKIICAAGSFSLGLVEAYGARAPGPCPALTEKPDGSMTCGMAERPRDYSRAKGGAFELRQAIRTMIGSGVGCDMTDEQEGDDEKLKAIQQKFLDRVGADEINRALATWFGLED